MLHVCNVYDRAGSREAHCCVYRMESIEESFNAFLSECFPPNTKLNTSGVFGAEFGHPVIQVLQDPADVLETKIFDSSLKQLGLQLLDLPKSWSWRSSGSPCKEECQGIAYVCGYYEFKSCMMFVVHAWCLLYRIQKTIQSWEGIKRWSLWKTFLSLYHYANLVLIMNFNTVPV